MHTINSIRRLWFVLLTILGAQASLAQFIGHTRYGLPPHALPYKMTDSLLFGRGVVSIGDLNEDGIAEIAVSEVRSTNKHYDAVRILFMDKNGAVDSSYVISTKDDVAGSLFRADEPVGTSLAAPGDLNNDGIPDLVLGAPLNSKWGGAIHILLLQRSGAVLDTVHIHPNTANFTNPPTKAARFGGAVCALGDLDFDGRAELLVGAPWDAAGDTARGAAYIISLDDSLHIRSTKRIARGSGELGGVPSADGDHFGHAVASLGDVDGNGYGDIAITAIDEDSTGVVHVILLGHGFAILGHEALVPGIANTAMGFGQALAGLGRDNERTRLAVGSSTYGGTPGQLWHLELDSAGTTDTAAMFTNVPADTLPYFPFGDEEQFAFSLALAQDMDANGSADLWVGSPLAGDSAYRTGTIWSLRTLAIPQPEHVPTKVLTMGPETGAIGRIEAMPIMEGMPALSWSKGTATGLVCDSLTAGDEVRLTIERTGKPDVVKHYTMGYEVHWNISAKYPLQKPDLVHDRPLAQLVGAKATSHFNSGDDLWAEYTMPVEAEGSRLFAFSNLSAPEDLGDLEAGFLFQYDGRVFSMVADSFTYQGSYMPGDVFKIARTDSVWYWFVNGDTLSVTSSDSTASAAHLFALLQGYGAKLSGLRTSNKPGLYAELVVGNVTEYAPDSGYIKAKVLWGKKPYAYLWSNSGTDKAIYGLSEGAYEVTISDAAGDTIVLDASITVTHSLYPFGGPLYASGELYEAGKNAWDMADILRENILAEGDTGWVQVSLPDPEASLRVAFANADSTVRYGLLVDDQHLYTFQEDDLSDTTLVLTPDSVPVSLTADDIIAIQRARTENGFAINILYNGQPAVTWSTNWKAPEFFLEVVSSEANAKGAQLVGRFTSTSGSGECDTPRNQRTVWTYHEDGALQNMTRTFMDHLGRPTQTHTTNLASRNVLVTETLYDGLGRPAIQTLPAPIYRSMVNCYRDGFVRSAAGVDYDIQHFDLPVNYSIPGEVYNPMPVQQTVRGTLGWYYSNNNTSDAQVPASVIPYARIIYHHDALGRAMATHAPGEQLKAGSGHGTQQFTMNGGDVLRHFSPPEKWGSLNVSKTITVDADGTETITYNNDRGQVLATCTSGMTTTCPAQRIHARLETNGERRLDIHVPASQKQVQGPDNVVSSLRLPTLSSANWNLSNQVTYTITDIATGLVLWPGIDYDLVAVNSVPNYVRFNGAYATGPSYLRISYELNLSQWDTQCCMPGLTSNTCCPSSTALWLLPDQQVWYTLDYGHWSINQYNDKGELTAVIPPEGVDCDVDFVYDDEYYVFDDPIMHICEWDDGLRTPQTVDNLIGTTLYSTSQALFGGNTIAPAGDNIERSFTFDTHIVGTDPVTVIEDPFPEDDYEYAEPTIPCAYVFHDPAPPQAPINKSDWEMVHYRRQQQQEVMLPEVRQTEYLQPNNGYAKWNPPAPLPGEPGPDPEPNPCEGMPAQLFGRYEVTLGYYGVTLYGIEELFTTRTFSASLMRTCQCKLYWNTGLNYPYVIDAWPATHKDLRVKLEAVEVAPGANWVAPLDNYDPTDYIHDLARYLRFHMGVSMYTQPVPVEPDHRMKQLFTYDALSQLVKSEDPDRGDSEMLYDTRGQLRFTQNAEQAIAHGGRKRFSFVDYDAGGRTVRSGVYAYVPLDGGYVQWYGPLQTSGQPAGPDTRDEDILEGLIPWNTAHLEEVTEIEYDAPAADFPSTEYPALVQRVLPGQVSRSANTGSGPGAGYESKTWYSYDVRGRMEWTVHYTVALDKYHTVHYEYNQKGQQKRKTYQEEEPTERFDHWYEYDANGRVRNLYTSTDGDEEERALQANYRYYLHGPLKRTELGDHLQGTDYVYTLQGWLKSINSPDDDEPASLGWRDPGRDGMDEGANAAFTPDLFGMALDYFDGDYVRSGSHVQSNPQPPAVTPYTDKYTGLVRAQRWNNRALDDDNTYRFGGQALMYWYGYDKLGQLTSAQLGTVAPTTMYPGAAVGLVNDYKVWNLTYDLNGNLLTLNRNGQQPVNLAMDQLTYHYNVDGNGHKLHNRTHRVTDAQSTTAYANTYQLPAGQGTNNYTYSATGQLEGDALEDRYYTYYASGRVKEVFSNSGMTLRLASFTYDAGGNRLCKTSYASNGTTEIERTWYLRDAGGGLLSYTTEDVAEETFSEELPIPGVGSYLRESEQVRYELTDHLGNTRVSFTADEEGVLSVVEAHDYYPHGGLMSGRQLTGVEGSPLAYQGQEYDSEVNLTAFNLRQYDARLGRWQTPDPYGQHFSPFLAMSNNPVMFVDADGGFDDLPENAGEEGGWSYWTLWLLMGGNQNMDQFMQTQYGALTEEEHHAWGKYLLSDLTVTEMGSNPDWKNTQTGRDINYIQSHLDGVSSATWNNWIQSRKSLGGIYATVYPTNRTDYGTIKEAQLNFMDRWSESTNILDQAAYSFVDGNYLLLQSNPIGRTIVGRNVRHLNGSIANTNEVVDGSMGSLPVPGAALVSRIAQLGRVSSVAVLEASAIRFSQSNVRSILPDIVKSMKSNGWQGAPIDVVRMPDGLLTSMDNTRVAAAAITNTPVQLVLRQFDEVLPSARSIPGSTWGEAVQWRMTTQNRSWQRLYPFGSPFTGVNSGTIGFTP